MKADDYYEQKEKTCQWIPSRLLPVADESREGIFEHEVNASDSEA